MSASPRGLSPHRLLADRLARQIELLQLSVDQQRDAQAGERYLDVLAGLSRGEEALRALDRNDLPACLDHLRASLELLERAQLDGLTGPFMAR
ncbi:MULTISPECIES: hypothetical protein [Thermocrispum]|jgi:hypothetical protein|uniref:Uncharacterized protein n=1 Tax=Thermocrispum agreste TaxID=37925 RepID=A0A2W4JRJ8_9PSEU|nr:MULTISPECIES: hypothetical protein [Thermocrispum]PZN00969.1 MAG: hypothetical protein DIU77_02140 [Thermocrispum agreste]